MAGVWKKQITELQDVLELGRSIQDTKGMRLFWPLSGIRFNYAGSSLRCEMDCSYGTLPIYVAVLMDRVPILRFPLNRGRHVYTILEGMERKRHEIEIVRETQPVSDDPQSQLWITGLEGDGSVTAPKAAACRIEFIGDSITCGEGAVGAPGNQEWNTIYLSPVNSYVHMITAELKAECHVVAAGGWGLYSDWKGVQEHNIPAIYERVCALSPDGDTSYFFDWQPDLVIINLGTNDTAAYQLLGKEEQRQYLETLETEAVAFLSNIRKRYPSAYLLWTYGMLGQLLSGVFRYAVARAKREGLERVGFLRLTECEAEEMGARQHPGQESHKRAARRILAYLEKNHVLEPEN